MNTIHGFGDSYTEGQPDTLYFKPFETWREYRGGTLPMGWLELLGDKLKMNTINYGVGGNSNDQIFDDICEHSHEINSGDIVIVNWTYQHRFRWPIPHDHKTNENGDPIWTWRKLSVNNDNPDDFKVISRSLKDEIIINRTKPNYIQEIYNRENLIESYAKAKGFDVYFWSTDTDIIYSLPIDKFKGQKKYILNDIINPGQHKKVNLNGGDFINMIIEQGGSTIKNETNGYVPDDTHLGEVGHKIQSELFYNYIVNNK